MSLKRGAQPLRASALAGLLCLSLVSCATPADHALSAAVDAGAPAIGAAGVTLRTDLPIRLVANIDVSSRSDVFSNVDVFDAGRSSARLRNGSYASWTYTSDSNAAGVVGPSGLGAVSVGPTLASVGVQSPMAADLDATTPVPPSVGCDVIDAEAIRLADSAFSHIAACKMERPDAKTEFVLFAEDGRHRNIGTHPLRIAKIAGGGGMHGASERLYLLTEADGAGTINLQWYSLPVGLR